LAPEQVELGTQLVQVLGHFLLVFICVLLRDVDLGHEFPCFFDVVDGEILAISQLSDCVLVDHPALSLNSDENEQAKEQEVEEAVHDEGQDEEVAIDEDTLLVAGHFHVHRHHHLGKTWERQDVNHVRAKWSEGSIQDDGQTPDHSEYVVESNQELHLLFGAFMAHRIDKDHSHSVEVEKETMVHVKEARSEGRERVKVLIVPDRVDAVNVLDFFLLDGFLMVCCADFVLLDHH
jgi:hypothetical protein